MSIASRFAVIFSLVVLIATATVGIMVYWGARNLLIRASTHRLAETASVVRVRFNAGMEGIVRDARFLAEVPPVRGLVRVSTANRRGLVLDPETAITDDEWRKQLGETLRIFLENRRTYYRVSFFGVRYNRLEFVRVEKRNNQVVDVPRSALRRDVDAAHLEEATALPRGEVFLSDIVLLQDREDLERDRAPTMQAAVPVYAPDNEVFGLLVIDVDLRDLFRNLQDLAGDEKALYLANAAGEFILRSDLGPGYDYSEGRPVRIQNLFPDAAPVAAGEVRPVSIDETRSATGVPLSAYFERMYIGPLTQQNAVILGVTSPHADILAGVKQVRDSSLFITLLFSFSGIALALALSRYLTAPILQVTRALTRFGREDWRAELPVDRQDETGVLARAYVSLAEKIQEQVVKLENEERRQRTILETSAEGIVVTDAEGVVEMMNPAAETLLGYRSDEAMGKRIVTMIRPIQGRQSAAGSTAPSSTSWLGVVSGDEGIGVRKDGTQVPLSVLWSSFDLNGARKYTVFLQDISERKSAESLRESLVQELDTERIRLKRFSETLEERVKRRTVDLVRINKALGMRNRELQDFAYVASHDLQEPLRKIRAFSDLLQTEHADNLDEESRFYLKRIYDAAERMSRLIADLLTYSRITSRGQPYEQVDLNQVVAEVLSDLEVACAEAGGRVIVDELPTLEADRTQMRQLLQNLIGNALKFHRPGVPPDVHVSCERAGAGAGDGEVERYDISVRDNGTGFDMKYLDRIFSPFQRLHRDDEYEGTGMGLSICRRIVERHDGTLTAESTLGEGSTFTVTLPARQRQADLAAAPRVDETTD